ncbi:RNA polymerase sigma factor [Pendulispora albinea]|uniref:RNA polymerase subunit sigma-24 n=1 Tax=Pendulispora albinea TaxID=2741071 RepID=A0ABZ2MCK2_9BACT
MHPAELAARASYGRLLSILAVKTHDLAGAEDALADAFLAALTRWPVDGVPRNPDAWLLTAARRRLVDAARRRRTRDEKHVLLQVNADGDAAADDGDFFGDERLRLLFVCAHPSIDAAARTPLMLQTVLGLDAARIATALRVAPKTMGQRLWRAKTKIRELRISFDVAAEDLPERSFAVLEAIYAAFGSGWEDVAGQAAASRGLTEEAIWLARLTVRLLPEEPEARGLLALMLFAEARAKARRGEDGAYIPLTEQDPSRWDPRCIAEAEAILKEAARMGCVGSLQLEAAVQSAHVDARRSGSRDDHGLSLLYEALVQMAPTLGVRVAHAIALSNTEGPARGLERLDAIGSAHDYQPYWSARAHLLERLGRLDEAREAYNRAAGLAEEDGIRRWLLAKKRALGGTAGASGANRDGV